MCHQKPCMKISARNVAKLEEVSTFSTNALQKCDTEMAKCSPAGVPKKGTVVSTFQKR